MNVDDLSEYQKDQLIRFLLHRLRQEDRQQLMVELPLVYRRMLGRDPNEIEFQSKIRSAVLADPLKDRQRASA